MKTPQRGFAVLNDPSTNQGTAFTTAEREKLGLRGLLPARCSHQDKQVVRVLANIRRKHNNLEKYIYLEALQGRNERLFYRTLREHIEELLPIVYTPTVGQACKEFAHIFRQTRGFYVTPGDRGQIKDIIKNWPHDDVRIIVITDGERILGLGDLGANGMGISLGKLALYTAGGGIHPNQCMPVQFDIGTNNKELRNDPLYLGIDEPRLDGDAYFELMDEFVEAVKERFPKALIQFEDFLTPKAYALLSRYRDKVLCFNDDIQGTAAVALAGIYASNRLNGVDFASRKVMFLGAGSAATGIADLLVEAFVAEGMSKEDARKRLWFSDVNGLLVKSRTDLMDHNLNYAQDVAPMSFGEAIDAQKPHILIGATGVRGTFTQEVVKKMTSLNDRPVIFALSNPTDRAECTAQQAYDWSGGAAIFASGSPFPAVQTANGNQWRPGQGNNAYIFPGIGLGAIGSQATRICDEMFLAAARTLAQTVSKEGLATGTIYPSLCQLPEVSMAIAVAVAETAYIAGTASLPKPVDIESHLRSIVFQTHY